MDVLWLLLTAFAILTSESEGQTDPCSSTVYSDISDLAKRDPSYAMDSVALCDRYISTGWYRGGYHRMPTSSPSLSFCGTLYPVWLNGQHPPENTISSVEVCKVGFSDPCSQRFNINVKNCSTYAVYQLQALDSCNSAYCFEPSTDCVAGVPTNLAVSYHSVSWKTEVNGIIKRHDPSVNLKCSFTPLSDNSLFYDISWYVDNVEVVSGQTVDSASLDDALLSAIDMLSKNKKAGSMIHCVVGAKRTAGGIACDKTSSPLFFAGIKVLTQQLTLDRGGTGTVRLQFTIPYTTENIVINNNAVDVSDLNVNLAVFNESSISCKDGNSKLCGIKVKGYSYSDRNKYSTDDWKQIYTINVFNRDNGDYTDFDRHITLRLETGGTNGDGSKIFESISLPDIQVYINEPTSAWKGRTCGAYTDPHMLSFDGYQYECQLDGNFILYRNELFNQEVQVKHHMCYPDYSYPRCTCAVAVRSGRDIFTVDICSGNTFINFPLCEDKVLKVIRKNDKRYQVLLPTGTLVHISLVTWPTSATWQIDVVIYPSASDVGNTKGLCGVLGGGRDNDLTRRDNTIDNPNLFNYGTHPNDFSISWRIPDDEDLFTNSQTVHASLNSISTTLTRVCTCKETSDRTGEIECNYGTFKDCKFKLGKQFHCILNPEGSRRRKRDLTHLKSLTENVPEMEPNEELHLARYKRQAVDVTTQEVAYNVCTKAFDESEAFNTCQQYVTDLSNTTIDNCISDVMMTGDYNITKIHIEAALEQCSTLVLYNTSFQVEQPEITYQVESLCPNNCSGNGVCNQGNCTCDPNFAGSDCGFDLLGPPTISHISDFGLCDKSNEECDEITLYGQLFLENMNTECYFTRRTLQEDGTIVSQAYLKTSLEPRTLFEGYCSLSYSVEPSWVSEFTFNVTNDGTRFTDSYNVHVYQSLCQEYQNTSGNVSFSLKNGYCFIDGKCYASGNTNPGNLCDLCNATYDKYNWTFNEGHCFIDNTCYVSGAINGTNACSACLPSIDPGNWSDNPGYCYIDNICYFDGQSKADNDCFVCNYTQNRNGWIFNEGYCLIDGGCFKAGENKTSESCKVCNPLQDKNNWTLSSGFCSINNSCLTDGESDPSNLCLMCNASINQYSLSPHPGYCDIGDLCIPDGQSNGSKPCLYCNASVNRDSWSFNQGYCFIDGICVEHGSNDTTKECKICNTSVNSSIWQIKDGYCYVQDNCYKDSDMNSTYPCQICNSSKSVLSWSSNSEYCNIDGLCVPNGQKNSTSACLYCNTSLSEMSWSASPGYCVIDGNCMEHGSNQTNKECQICDAYSNTSNWQLKDGYCFIQDQCVKDNELNATFPCLMCNATNKRDAWSDNSEYCNIDGLCLPNGHEDGSSVCHYCNTSLSKEAWSFRPGYCLIDGICVEHGENKTNMECHICDVNFNTSSWKLKDEYCNIDGLCVPNGQKNSTSACFYCNTSLSGVAWSFTPGYCVIDGICIEHGTNQTNKECQICNAYSNTSSWQLKGGYCFIKDQCVKDNELNATFPCLMCNASSKQDAWSDNLEYCNIGGVCLSNGQENVSSVCHYCNTSLSKEAWSFRPGYCLIDGFCVEHGKNKTNMECHICDANFNTSSWKLKDEYCNIDGICVSNGQTNGTHPCFYCNTSINREMWSFSPDYCLINGVCVEHGRNNTNMECQICDVYANVSSWQLKEGHCLIQDSCYKMDEVHGMHPCHICNVTHNPYVWSANPAYCSIDGQCISHGQRNNSNACSYCNVSLSTDSWSSTPGYCLIDGICVEHGTNKTNKECQICNAYTNTSSWQLKYGHCIIQDNCYEMNEVHEIHPCHICNVTENPYSWSSNPDYCNIDGQCISHGQKNNTNACSYCNVSLSTTTWSSTPGYCLIDGICVEHGNNNTNKECQICDVYSNTSCWQLKDGYCFIQEQCIKDNEENSTYSCQICNATRSQYSWSSNPDYCDIDGQCISHGQRNNTHACSYCNVSLSRNKWSFSTGYCLIDGICVEHGNNKTNKECQICNAYTNTSNWQLKDGYCFIQDKCIKENEANTTYPCHICNATSNPYSWSSNPEYCNIDGQCASNGQANGTNACFYCNTSLSKAAWSFSPGYCFIQEQCIKDNEENSTYTCQICNATLSQYSWSSNPDNCDIDGQCISHGQKNNTHACSYCNVSLSRNKWSFSTGYCFIQDMCIKENEANTTYPCHICNATSNPYSWSSNPEYCNIDGQCASNGQANGTNVCFYCNTSLSKAAWSFSPGYCRIDGMCVEHGRNKTNSECQLCDANVNTSSWQLKDGYCLIQDQCFKDTEKNLSNPCEICNVTSGKYVWSSNIDCLTTTLESTTDSSTSNITDPSTSTTPETSTSAEALTTTTIMDTTTTMESSTEALMITTAAVDTTTVDITTSTTMEPSTETSTTTEMDTTITSTTMGSSTEALTTMTAVETTSASTTVEPSTEPPTTTEMDTTSSSTTLGSSTEALTTTTAVETTTLSTTMKPSSTIGITATMDTTTTSATPEPSTTTTDSSTTSKTDSTTTPTSTAPYTSTTSTTAETTTLSTCIGNANITNVSVSYHNISWNTLTHNDGEINSTTHTPSINMKCSFVPTSQTGLYYQIVWYIYTDNRTRIHNETVTSSSSDPSVISLMSINRTLGYEIQCTVGLTRNPSDEPCSIVESERFFVGLKVLDNHVAISRKAKSTVRFHLTVPYVTTTEIVDGKEQPLSSLNVQATVISQSTDSCAGQVVVNGCSMIINAHSYENRSNYVNENWKEVYHFTIYHLDTDAYVIDTSALISLTTMDNRNGIFNALHENISVLIEDRQDIWKGKSCGSKTDPHLYTFDGRSYENHLNGTFVLYHNALYNQKIQTKHHQCHPDYDFPKCICAVSMQSGRDVFIIDICDNNQLLDFAACADGTLSFYRESDKVYKIIFPTGTSAIISLLEWPSGTNSWQVDVDVYPSLLDVNNTAGLCGTLDENQDNEFRHRNGVLENYSEYPNTFSTAWIVPDDENLLNSGARQSLTSISSFLDHICTCRNGESLCAYDTYRQCTQTKRRRCSETANVLSRKKRSLDLKRDTFTSYDRVKRQTPSNVKSTSEAETICTAQFEQSEPYKICRQHVGDLSNSSLSNCIKDIVMTGDENITSIHIEAALQQCVKFVLFNTTLQNAEPSVTYELTTLCPNNCSNKGICNEGNCTCLDGYGGSDCSFDIGEPPKILRLSVNETCDKSTQDCSQIIIDGAYFLENVNNVCFYTRQLILHDRTEGASLTSEYPVEALSLFQGACPLVYDTDETWVTKFTMNVSNDRVRFSKSFYLYTYQSECQQINRGSNDVYFTLKDNFCFVNKTCLPQHTKDSYNSCSVCDPQRAKFSWSLHQDCVSATTSAPITTTESFTSHPIFLATISVAAAVCFLTVIIVGICCYRMKSDKEDLSDSESSDSVNSGYRSPWINSYGKPIAKVFIPRARLFPNRSVSSSGYYPDWKQ